MATARMVYAAQPKRQRWENDLAAERFVECDATWTGIRERWEAATANHERDDKVWDAIEAAA
jgi:hypothetical protein